MIENGAVLPMFYLPPVDYFTNLVAFTPDVVFEREEHFPKQTYRNRANIYSPDGRQVLTVPVIKGSKNHTVTKDVKISYDFRWQRAHWMGLQTCYRNSAYFEYYEDDFAPFYEKQTAFLLDYNTELMALLLRLLKIKMDIQVTDTYETTYPNLTDLRTILNGKNADHTQQKPYFQVFEERRGFLQNLSIVDLLFNQGPQALNYL
ncbi:MULTISPECIES: WbqC family protein [unclassified Mucilaginibacter]|uniref:WbqC family protein n=1 Tax=unclassified Mucilaginibacter TaxID=2617802 RepID=UPI002AC90736|nr:MULTISPECIES: WbqC family protein [unclassified Mucilaginibacter]MEB0261405.1 WbqC family protein [Mucilaginibacter sp. 10I4]MEB0278836.1 WbqC family protein [Mucilaginibacter sp. 10B2]MEB0299798.1 WbqC family protein [Mucilaginibacter sp. 5C4]WPX22019.1 WbqC family protein [Mucilaginibacter sp. 5C4]